VVINKNGLVRALINRDVYAAVDISDAIVRATQMGSASGFSINLGSVVDSSVVNVEVGPQISRVKTVKNGFYYHFNMYRDLAVKQHVDNSSIHRLARAQEMKAPTDQSGIIQILGDTQDPSYPIFRDSKPPDCCSTVSTTIFDLNKMVVIVWVANPKTSSAWLTLNIPSK